jgi:hypothetical protein
MLQNAIFPLEYYTLDKVQQPRTSKFNTQFQSPAQFISGSDCD